MKTKRVRIAVAMASDGEWAAGGSSNPRWTHKQLAEDSLGCITDTTSKVFATLWIEADVPIPHQPPDIEGEVVA